MRPGFLSWLLAFALFAGMSATSSSAQTSTDPRPNVIVILSDDQGYGDFSCHGNPVLKTPNLDRLHDEGVRLTDFHVAPMCTPTRGQLLSGQDALRTRASSVCAGRSFLPRGAVTMPQVFADHGYKTALFGKWHLGDSYPNLPEYRGFGEAVYHLGWGITSMADLWQNDVVDGQFLRNGKRERFPGYCTDVWFGLAADWIRDRASKDEPFFLYLPTNAPHGPLWVDPKYSAPYEGRGPANFFGMIANLDENVGKLEELLNELKLRENTIVVFFNDNGATAGFRLYNAGMRGQKTTYYEGGHRAACFVRWPGGNIGGGRDVNGLTQVQDLFPTLLDLCGLPRPENARFDGLSLAGALKGTATPPRDRTLVVQYGQRPLKWEGAVLRDRWRLVQGTELYNLETDPDQSENVAASHPDVLASLRRRYEAWWAEIAPSLDDFHPISIGAPQANPVTLSAADWANVYCDNMNVLRQGVERNGPWHLLVERGGTYEITLRRWPKEANAAISAPVPAFEARYGRLAPGRALPVNAVRLRIGDAFDETKPAPPDATGVTFRVELKEGRTTMQGALLNADGSELAGAYFADVQLLDAK